MSYTMCCSLTPHNVPECRGHRGYWQILGCRDAEKCTTIGSWGQVKTHMITLNNESGRISCYVFVCLFTCILPLLPYSLASGGWCVCIISRGLVSSGFWLGSDEGRGALDRDWRGGLAGKLRSKYLGCWVPPSVDAPLTEDLSTRQCRTLSRHRNIPSSHSFRSRHWFLHCLLGLLYSQFPLCDLLLCK